MKDLIIPIAVLLSLASILLPLPPSLLDALIVSNLMLALLLLVSALNLSEPTKLAGLPTLLLLATLYRLALNISTTRSILSTGDGGKTVEAFGSIVIQGNIVVGFVIFVLITIIQFIVIAKGSERVAEVAARFTLDALPGKQMSIDAELRAGMLDPISAKQKRQDLQVESRFYGALDGAMKFVKGDAIAGMLIVIVNVLGGLAIGMFSEGLDFQQALYRYTTLSVGDGLVSQIPALLNALAAGVVVTRVNRGDQLSLSSDLLNQLGQYRLVTGLVAFVSLGLACFPGFPSIPFVVIAIFLGIVTVSKKADDTQQVQQELAINFNPQLAELLAIAVNHRGVDAKRLAELAEQVRNKLFSERGMLVPTVFLYFSEKQPENGIALELRGFEIASYTSDNIDYDELRDSFSKVLLSESVELIDDSHTRRLLALYEKKDPELVSSLVPQVISVTKLTEICRQLLEEEIPLRNFDLILQALAEHSLKISYPTQLLEEVRVAIRRSIAETIASKTQAIYVEPMSDYIISQRERRLQSLELKEVLEIGTQIKRKLSNDSNDRSIVVVSSRGARRLIREALMMQNIILKVVALEEINKLVELKEIAKIHLASATDPSFVAEVGIVADSEKSTSGDQQFIERAYV